MATTEHLSINPSERGGVPTPSITPSEMGAHILETTVDFDTGRFLKNSDGNYDAMAQKASIDAWKTECEALGQQPELEAAVLLRRINDKLLDHLSATQINEAFADVFPSRVAPDTIALGGCFEGKEVFGAPSELSVSPDDLGAPIPILFHEDEIIIGAASEWQKVGATWKKVEKSDNEGRQFSVEGLYDIFERVPILTNEGIYAPVAEGVTPVVIPNILRDSIRYAPETRTQAARIEQIYKKLIAPMSECIQLTRENNQEIFNKRPADHKALVEIIRQSVIQ